MLCIWDRAGIEKIRLNGVWRTRISCSDIGELVPVLLGENNRDACDTLEIQEYVQRGTEDRLALQLEELLGLAGLHA